MDIPLWSCFAFITLRPAYEMVLKGVKINNYLLERNDRHDVQKIKKLFDFYFSMKQTKNTLKSSILLYHHLTHTHRQYKTQLNSENDHNC